jgi:hypothetical protein
MGGIKGCEGQIVVVEDITTLCSPSFDNQTALQSALLFGSAPVARQGQFMAEKKQVRSLELAKGKGSTNRQVEDASKLSSKASQIQAKMEGDTRRTLAEVICEININLSLIVDGPLCIPPLIGKLPRSLIRTQ